MFCTVQVAYHLTPLKQDMDLEDDAESILRLEDRKRMLFLLDPNLTLSERPPHRDGSQPLLKYDLGEKLETTLSQRIKDYIEYTLGEKLETTL